MPPKKWSPRRLLLCPPVTPTCPPTCCGRLRDLVPTCAWSYTWRPQLPSHFYVSDHHRRHRRRSRNRKRNQRAVLETERLFTRKASWEYEDTDFVDYRPDEVRVHSRSPWKSSSAIDPTPGPLLVNSPRISFTQPTISQVSLAGNAANNEKIRLDQQTGNANSWMGFAKLARFLNQREKEKAATAAAAAAAGTNHHRPCRRTHSLENEDLSVRKASSIDSLVVEPSYDLNSSGGGGLGKEPKSIPSSPSFPSRLERPCADLQSSPSLHYKLYKNRAGWSRESVEYLVDGLSINKAERKKLEKVNKINIHMHALFLAVEHQQIDRARAILEHADLDINSVNSDGFNPLDIAVFTQNVPISKLLLSYGAKENPRYKDHNYCANYINGLIQDSEQKIDNLTSSVINTPVNSNVSNSHHIKESEKQLSLWERRFRLLKKMKMGFEQTRPPDLPSSVTLHVVGTNNLRIEIEEPDFQTGAVVTKYKVEWSCHEDFNSVVGMEELFDLRLLDYVIGGLQPGTRYFVRVAAGNVKGYSAPKYSTPMSAVPSIWRDVDGRLPRTAGRLSTMEDLFNQIRNSRPEYASEIKGIADQLDTPAQQRKNQMKKSIRSLFTPAPKFYKHLKRGVFLSSILYNEDKVLITTEEYLPVVEVDETYPSSLHTDFHWMMKVACTWDDVKSLRQDMDKSLSSSTVHFRSRLLQAAAQMQSALGVQDLGQFFYRPIKDNNGTLVLSTICHVKDVKSINAISMKWIPISKLRRKLALSGLEVNAGEILLASVSEQIQYSQRSQVPIQRGLYLGYVKLKSSMDLIRVLVPENTPNVLPHYRIRENPHVSCEEWGWLTRLSRSPDGPASDDRATCAPDDETAADLDKESREEETDLITDVGAETADDQTVGDGLEKSDSIHGDNDEDGGSENGELERHNNTCNNTRRHLASSELSDTLSCCGSSHSSSEVQLQFGRQVLSAAKHLFAALKVDREEARSHRLFDVELIELSADVAFLLVLPSVENVCSIPGQGGDDEFVSRQGFVALPVQIFEMIHMSTYQHDFISRYSRLSSILEMDTLMAHHAHREAFSSSEVIEAKQRLVQLQDFQLQVDNTWKGMRWIMDVLTYARDKLANGGVPLACLYERFDVYSPMVDTTSPAFGYRHTSSGNPSIASGRSMDSVHFINNFSGSGGKLCSTTTTTGGGISPFRTSDMRCRHPAKNNLQVPGNRSPTAATASTSSETSDSIATDADRRAWSNTIGSGSVVSKRGKAASSIPKSFSDSFSAIGIRDVTVTLSGADDDNDYYADDSSVSYDAASLTPSLRSASSGELPIEEAPIARASAENFAQQCRSAHHSPRRTNHHPQHHHHHHHHSEPPSTSVSSDDVGTAVHPSKTDDGIAAADAASSSVSARPSGAASLQALVPANEPGVLRVYAAYETGLGGGASIRLHVTPQTTAREVINLVVRQLNMAAVLKGGRGSVANTNEQLPLFCLVAVIGARERCLRDDFCPLKLQNPWTSGRLYVRMKHQVLAALEHQSHQQQQQQQQQQYLSSSTIPIAAPFTCHRSPPGDDDDCCEDGGELPFQPSSL